MKIHPNKQNNPKESKTVAMREVKSQYSEEIVKKLIDKIITLTFSQILYTKVNSQINQFCIENTFKSLNQFIELQNINHEIDDCYPEHKKNLNFSFKLEKRKKMLIEQI